MTLSRGAVHTGTAVLFLLAAAGDVSGVGRMVGPDAYIVDDYDHVRFALSEAELEAMRTSVRAWGLVYVLLAFVGAALGVGWLALWCGRRLRCDET